MRESVVISVVVACVLIVSWALWRVLNSIWWRPMMMDRCLREQGIKGPSYKLLYGNLKENLKLIKEAQAKPIKLNHDIVSRAIPFIHQTVKKYGKNSFFWFGTNPRMIIMDPELIREILSNKFGQFEKPKSKTPIKKSARNLANSEGEQWAKHRRIINPAFHLEKLKRMLPAFYTCCSELVNRWEKLVSSGESCELDVWLELQNLTGDVISRTAFGSSYEEGRQIFQLQSEVIKLMLESLQSVYIPGFRFLPTKKNNRMKQIDREVGALLRGIINKKEMAIKMGEAGTNDLLGILLESNHKEIQEDDNCKNVGLSIEEVMQECKLFYFAGQETTSVLLMWTMVVLSMHPNWQVRAREEVLQVFGNNKPDFNGLNNLKLVTMILYEVLRLYPPLASLTRCTSKNVKLGDNVLPPEVQLLLPIILIHHDHELWGEDADEFKPERFAGGVSKATKNPNSFLPFGWGPRICIGQNFSMIEAKIALAMILQRFSFELAPTYTHAPYTIITLQLQYGAPLILHKL